jgi:hypothetical protein
MVKRTYQTIQRHIPENINQHEAQFQLKENTAKYRNCGETGSRFAGHKNVASGRSRRRLALPGT